MSSWFEDDALDVRAVLQETRLGLFVGAIDLEVVLSFALARQAGVEGLMGLVVVVSMALEKAAAVLRQTDGLVPVSRHTGGLDQPFFAQVSQVAGPWISRAPIVVSEITTGDHSECTNGCERSRFRAAQGVLAIAVMNELALAPARQVNVSCECVSALTIAFSIVAIAVRPAGIVIAVAVASMPV